MERKASVGRTDQGPMEPSGCDAGPPGLGFDHAAASVPDLDAATEWYERVLGFVVARRFVLEDKGIRAAMMRRGDLRVELFEPALPIPSPSALLHPDADAERLGNKHVGFRVADIDAMAAWLMRQRVRIVHRATGPFGAALFIHDQAGNLIEFVARPLGS